MAYLRILCLLVCLCILSTWAATKEVAGNCPNMCSGHGRCDKFARCSCEKGFQGADCSERICPFGAAWSDLAQGTDNAHNPAECSNRGLCNRKTGHCECAEGFTGSACERLSCFNDCSKRGVCQSMRLYAERNRDEDSNNFEYTEIWDSEKIWGCRCDYPASGYDCSQTLCPNGDDPLTAGQVNEVQLVECVAQSGSFVLFYKGHPSGDIPFDGSERDVEDALQKIPFLRPSYNHQSRKKVGGVKVSFSVPHAKVCQLQRSVISVEFLGEFGPLHPLVPLLDEEMRTSGGQVEVKRGGESARDVLGVIITSVEGTKERQECAGRGSCDTSSGVCSCFSTETGDVYGSSDGYGSSGERGDCGHLLSTSSSLSSSSNAFSCPNDCNGHGVCDAGTKRCHCSEGWRGGDCRERECPKGLSWFDYPTRDNSAHLNYEECSNMGLCDRVTGQCRCRAGFYGQSCQFMSCTSSSTSEAECSGHGRCLSLAQLALESRVNGVPAGFSYGLDRNKPQTWDAFRIHGCLCDSGYSGYDCSQRLCPSGDDRGTYLDHSETQILHCSADLGNFTLSFRGESTPPLSYNTSAVELQQALSRLSSIESAAVFFLLDDSVLVNGTYSHHLSFQRNASVSLSLLSGALPPKEPQSLGRPPWVVYNSSDGRFLDYLAPDPPLTRYNTSLCDPEGRQVAVVVFKGNHGDLPALEADTTWLINTLSPQVRPGSGTLRVYSDGESVSGLTSIKGTTEVEVCNGRGLCDTSSGECRCFGDWTSGDGQRQGGAGNKADCGYRNDKKYSYFQSIGH